MILIDGDQDRHIDRCSVAHAVVEDHTKSHDGSQGIKRGEGELEYPGSFCRGAERDAVEEVLRFGGRKMPSRREGDGHGIVGEIRGRRRRSSECYRGQVFW